MNYTLQTRKSLLRAKHELLDVKVDLKFVKFLRAATKAGFNPDQPRDEDGKWTGAADKDSTLDSTGVTAIDGGATDFSAVVASVSRMWSTALLTARTLRMEKPAVFGQTSFYETTSEISLPFMM